jgi:(2Fe-2S) ferredoxin
MFYYRYHVFFCTNQREDGRACCQQHNALEMRDYVKSEIKQRGLSGKGGVRINTAGCLDRCEEGPVLVIYPDEVWYTFVDKEDLDEIIEEHLVNNKLVERLMLK